MSGESTKQQLKDWIEKTIADSKNPDPIKAEKKKLDVRRKQKRKNVEKQHGL